MPVPDHRRFALVGDADGGDLAGVNAAFLQCALHHIVRLDPDLERVVFHPAGLGVNLTVFLLVNSHHFPCVVKNDETRAGSALVDGCDVFFHFELPFLLDDFARRLYRRSKLVEYETALLQVILCIAPARCVAQG